MFILSRLIGDDSLTFVDSSTAHWFSPLFLAYSCEEERVVVQTVDENDADGATANAAAKMKNAEDVERILCMEYKIPAPNLM